MLQIRDCLIKPITVYVVPERYNKHILSQTLSFNFRSFFFTGHEDGSCMIYDITAGRTLQLFSPHTMDCRSVRFSPDNRFLLTGSYDTSIILMDVRKNLDIEIPPYSVVANHRDKVIQCRWHPSLPAFLSSSADKTVTLWAPDD